MKTYLKTVATNHHWLIAGIMCVIVFGVALLGYDILMRMNGTTRTIVIDASMDLNLIYPNTWSAERRGEHIALWTNTMPGDLTPISFDTVTKDKIIPSSVVVVSFWLVHDFGDSLEGYSEYVEEYDHLHPIQTTSEVVSILTEAELASFTIPHVVINNKIFLELNKNLFATVTIQMGNTVLPNQVATAKRDIIKILKTL